MPEDQALERLREILARPEYQVDLSHPWWDQLLQPLGDLLTYAIGRFVQTLLDASSGREGWYGLGAIAVCTVLIAVVLLYLVRAIRLSVAREGRISQASLAQRRERSERLWQTGQQLAAAGQWAEAVRTLYLSALYALDERALLHVDSSLTNREHARELRRLHPEVAQTFSDVVDNYDRVRYGRLSVSEQTFTELSGLVARARAAALHGTAA